MIQKERLNWLGFGGVVFLVLIISFAIYYNISIPLRTAPPAESHTLLALEHGERFGLNEPFAMGHAFGPRYAAYYTFIIQNALSGFNFPHYVTANALFIAVSLSASFVMFRQFAGRTSVAIFCVVFLALCIPIWEAGIQWLTGRQGPLALLFGMLFLIYLSRPRAHSLWASNGILTVLIALALTSKEFSLAVLPAGILYVVADRRWRDVWCFIGPVAFTILFIVFRLTVLEDASIEEFGEAAKGATLKCEDMAFFMQLERTCISLGSFEWQTLKLVLYNFFVGNLVFFFPPVIEQGDAIKNTGQFGLETLNAVNVGLALVILASLIVTFVQNRKIFVFAMAMTLMNALVLIAFFRLRNFGFTYVATSLVLGIGVWRAASLFWFPVSSWLNRRATVRSGGRFLSMDDRKIATGVVLAISALALVYLIEGPADRLKGHMAHLAVHRSSTEIICLHVRYILERENRLNPEYRTDPETIRKIMLANGVDLTRRCPDRAVPR